MRLFKLDVELDWPLAERNRRSRWFPMALLLLELVLLLFVWLGLPLVVAAELREFCCES